MSRETKGRIRKKTRWSKWENVTVSVSTDRRLLDRALAYQETLTKRGTVRKRRKAVADV